MHRDKKVGLALGVLLVGVVGAFFFRNESNSDTQPPKLLDPHSLNQQIAERPLTPYLTGYETEANPVSQQGDGINPQAQPPAPIANNGAQPYWALPEFLRDEDSHPNQPADPQPIGGAAQLPRHAPQHNQQWRADDRATNRYRDLPGEEAQRGAMSESRDVGMQHHRVQPRDTLTGLAHHYLGNSDRFMEIFNANRDRLTSPDRLPVGKEIRIPLSMKTELASSQDRREQYNPERYHSDNRRASVDSPRDVSARPTSQSNRSFFEPYEKRYPVGTTRNRSNPFDGYGNRQPATPVARSNQSWQPMPQRQPAGSSHTHNAAPWKRHDAAGSNQVDSRTPVGRITQRPTARGYESGTAGMQRGIDAARLQQSDFGIHREWDPILEKKVPSQWQAQPSKTLPQWQPNAALKQGQNNYVIQKGDNLEEIAERFYGRRTAAGKIYAANKDRLQNPYQMRVGTRIVLPLE